MPKPQATDRIEIADRLHSAAIHLLRRLRRVDEATKLSAPKLSALSVLVFSGPKRLGELADAEQVRPATMSRLVKELESDGLLERSRHESDGRVVTLKATQPAVKLLKQGRGERVKLLASWMKELSREELKSLERAVDSIDRLGDS